ncbi:MULTISPECIES: DUF5330 domain-containing protein [unclassified Bartonella]|uniref:DUF5330 domain-containing protein n=2 Tax=Bartonella TaxID=773 RepID=UPI000999FECD|nr:MULTISPECIES: DUF5330 domain-containing protein [unclassified Bartonella]AQX23208.1 hypothetical protein Bho11B_012100 [Bartonella sp. 11B]AQX23491.1 hypothetical protein Bho114_001480 [Bartonella sp. 114]AQX25665.1 hypothetical protein Bco22_009920 [Bartonella sp. Coyote22sub2]
MIRFLIKSAFFLFFIFIIISFFTTKQNNNNPSSSQETDATTRDMIVALKETINDLGMFCERNIEACKIGKSFLESMGERARNGSKIIYEYLDHTLSNKNMKSSQEDHSSTGMKNPKENK